MRVWLMKEFGYEEALFGLGLSYGLVSGYATPEDAQQHDEWSRLCELAPQLALYGSGGNSTNTIEPVIFAWIRLDDELAKAFCRTCIITSPGIRKLV